jgi:hypothetical protein
LVVDTRKYQFELLRQDIATFREEVNLRLDYLKETNITKLELANHKNSIILWLVSTMLTMTGIIVGVMLKIHGHI